VTALFVGSVIVTSKYLLSLW